MSQKKISITDRSGQIERYFSQINKLNPLSKHDEIELSLKIKNGDENALNKLVSHNLKFVISIAKGFQNNGLGLEDLIEEGNIGLIEAAKRFDPEAGTKFITFAVYWIKLYIRTALAEKGKMVRIPVNQLHSIHKDTKGNKFTSYAKEFSSKLKSLDDTIGDDNQSILDIVENVNSDAPDSSFNNSDLSYVLLNAIKELKPTQKRIISMHFGLGNFSPMSIDAIAEEIDLTPQRVRQLIKSSLIDLNQIAGNILISYL